MQAIFDPIQGFFNAILFVFLSESDRQNIFYLFCVMPVDYLMGRESSLSPSHRPTTPSLFPKSKKRHTFFHRFTSFISSSSFSTSLLHADQPLGRERAPQSSSHRSDDGYSSQYYRDGANDSENDHVGLSRISESGTMRDSEVYINSQHRIRDASFVYENDSVSEYSVK